MTMSCPCGNAARYVDQHGQLTCGICPLRAGDDSIKIADVPRLLAWARSLAAQHPDVLDIIGRKPT